MISSETKESIPEFGLKRENEERRDGGCAAVFDPKSQKYAVGKRPNGLFILFSGGVEANEDIQEGILREVTEESGLHEFLYVENIGKVLTHYRHGTKHVNRVAHATCFLVILKNTSTVSVKLGSHEDFTLEWATAQEIISNWEERNQNEDYSHWIYFLRKGVKRAVELGYDKTSKI